MNKFLKIVHSVFKLRVREQPIEERYKALNLTLTLSENRNQKPTATVTRINKNDRLVTEFAYYFKSEESRTEYITKFIERREKAAADIQNRKANKKAVSASFKNPFAIGHIFVNSWGYEQTNVDFYQVIEVKAKSVVLMPIAYEIVEATGPMSAEVAPLKDEFKKDSKPVLKQVLFFIDCNNQPVYYLKANHGSLNLHAENETHYKSWYA